MFYVKAAFWIFLILLLIPTSDKEKSDFYIAAGRTISDLSGFCTRNPDVCDKAGSIFDSAVRKLRASVRIIEDAVSTDGGKAGGDDGGGYSTRERSGDPRSRRGAGAGASADTEQTGSLMTPATNVSQNTLRPTDREPAWRGPGGV